MMQFTIGIPVHNEEKNLNMLLNYLAASKFNFKAKEIIVVCSGCTDNSLGIAKKCQKRNRLIKIFHERERKGKFSAINKILSAATSNYVILINSDTLPEINSLNVLVEPFADEKVAAVTGRPICIQKNNTLAGYFHNFMWNYHHEMSRAFPNVTGEICALRKNTIKKLPNKIINDDEYIASSLFKNSVIKYVPKATSKVIENLDINNYLKKRRRFAAGHIQISKMRPKISIPIAWKLKFILNKIQAEPEKIFHIVLIVLIEIYSNILAFYDIQRGKIDYKWDT